MSFFISSYNHGVLSAKYNESGEQSIFTSKPVLKGIEKLEDSFTTELGKKITFKKVYLGLAVYADGEKLTVLPKDLENNRKEIKRAVRLELFKRRSQAEDQRKAWELIYAPFRAESEEPEQEVRQFKKHGKSNRKQFSKKTKRRHFLIERSLIYGEAEVKRIYAESAYRRSQGEPVSVDHFIPLMGTNSDGEWVVSGLTVPNNLRIIPQIENNNKANFIDLEELNRL